MRIILIALGLLSAGQVLAGGWQMEDFSDPMTDEVARIAFSEGTYFEPIVILKDPPVVAVICWEDYSNLHLFWGAGLFAEVPRLQLRLDDEPLFEVAKVHLDESVPDSTIIGRAEMVSLDLLPRLLQAKRLRARIFTAEDEIFSTAEFDLAGARPIVAATCPEHMAANYPDLLAEIQSEPEQLSHEPGREMQREDAIRGGLLDQWMEVIRQKVQRNWVNPPSAGTGIECEVRVTQIPGGEVVDVRISRCNADATVVRSIENAVYRASPLPPPPDASLFERNVIFIFRPTD